jgi:peptide/nickel transport system permease protein
VSVVSADSGPAAAPAPAPPAAPAGRRRARWYRLPTLLTGVVLLVIIVFMCYAAPLLTSFDPNAQNLEQALLGLGQAGHLLGTDQEGRDTWARLLYGGQVDLRIAVIAVILPFILGIIVGSLAGYFGGWVDAVIMRIVDIVVAFPFFVLVIALVFVLGTGEKSIYIAITAVGWVSYARITRGEITVAKRQEYVLAAQSGGLSSLRIITRHLLPNVITQSIVYAMSDIVQDILAIVTLSYLGLGVQPPTADWGTMISVGQNFLTTQWWLTTVPGIAVVITGLALSLVGDGLADLLRTDAS